MLKAEQIPDEVFEAFQKAWAVTSTLSTKECLAAAINAWPGSEYVFRQPHRLAVSYSNPAIILPLPMEQAVKVKETRDE